MSTSRITPELRKVVAERANGFCEYCRCQEKFSPDSFEVEHIIPRSRGGTDDLENLSWTCGGCNGYKGTKTKGRDPVTALVSYGEHPPQEDLL
ncbi:MAG: HNH endonuclease signature motif containing protein [Leptolyngbyaceae cyanobacterium bins.302]|nr:HNH endonuclease signature motif containing protein [Leptolyngbyaceae cyanobacterium bins.302]